MGIVAPHCTIVLEIIRDPISFARSRMSGPMLVLLCGSMPLLPRSARSGFVLAADVAHKSRIPFDCSLKANAIDLSDLRGSLAGIGRTNSENELVITVEPDIESGSSAFVFCGWFAGDINFELDPLVTFKNLIQPHFPNYGWNDKHKWAAISPMDLIDVTHFQLVNGHAIFNAQSDPAWLLVAAGCARDGHTNVLQGSIDDISILINHSYYPELVEGFLFIWFEA